IAIVSSSPTCAGVPAANAAEQDRTQDSTTAAVADFLVTGPPLLWNGSGRRSGRSRFIEPDWPGILRDYPCFYTPGASLPRAFLHFSGAGGLDRPRAALTRPRAAAALRADGT